MDSVTAPTESANLSMIKVAFEVSVAQGFLAGLEALLERAHEDCEFRPYIASDHIISDADAIRAFYRSAATTGTDMRRRAATCNDAGDTVIVNGSLPAGRPSGA